MKAFFGKVNQWVQRDGPIGTKEWIFFALIMLMVSAYPALPVYLANRDLVYFSAFLKPLGIYLAMYLGAFTIGALCRFGFVRSVAWGFVFVLWFQCYHMFEWVAARINGGARYWHIIAIYIFLISVVFAALKTVKIPAAIYKNVLTILCVVFIALNGYAVINAWLLPAQGETLDEGRQLVDQGDEDIEEAIDSGGQSAFDVKVAKMENPYEGVKLADDAAKNVYYFVLDEYSRGDILQTYFDFDNSPFFDALSERKFNISHSSISPGPQTLYSVPNLLFLQHFTEGMDARDIRRVVQVYDYPLFELFSTNDYYVYSTTTMPRQNQSYIDASIGFNDLEEFRDISKQVFDKTMMKWFASDTRQERYDNFTKLFANLTTHLSGAQAEKRFAFIHLITPHDPYVFDADGSYIPREEQDDYASYIRQLQYVNTWITGVVDELIERDPDCVIIIQSDHGHKMVTAGLETQAAFNAVYFGGEAWDVEGLGTVDTLTGVIGKMQGR